MICENCPKATLDEFGRYICPRDGQIKRPSDGCNIEMAVKEENEEYG